MRQAKYPGGTLGRQATEKAEKRGTVHDDDIHGNVLNDYKVLRESYIHVCSQSQGSKLAELSRVAGTLLTCPLEREKSEEKKKRGEKRDRVVSSAGF